MYLLQFQLAGSKRKWFDNTKSFVTLYRDVAARNFYFLRYIKNKTTIRISQLPRDPASIATFAFFRAKKFIIRISVALKRHILS